MLESTIEKHMFKQAKNYGLLCRKVKWIGRRGAPDRLLHGVFVELKRPGAKPEPHQLREHDLMRKAGMRVEVVDSIEGVDELINEIRSQNTSANDN